MRNLWPQVMDALKASRTIWAMLEGAQVMSLDGEVITLAVAPSLAKRVAEDRNSTIIVEAVKSLVSGSWQLVVVPLGTSPKLPEAGAAPGAPSVRPDRSACRRAGPAR